MTDHADAAGIAADAGRLLLEIREGLGAAGADADAVRREGDQRAHDLIVRALADRHPADAVVSEEGAGPVAGAGPGRVWIVDPLDGTREFGEPGRPDWAVHVALVVGHAPRAGAVALPARGMVLATAPAGGGRGAVVRALSGRARRPADAWSLPPRPPGLPVRLVVSRSRPPALVGELARRLGAELVPLGSAGAKAMAVVLGEADAYVHAGGQHEWDSAAPVAVAVAAGLHACRLDGSPLRYGRPGAELPDLVVCRPELAGAVLGALAGLAAPVASPADERG
ncbi:MAG TPA: 3'(2'),5'-bisphosphate nucleotidase CysQ [Acidimicrobiales bacterium]|nr:3'(2'),5'-bisphosphate nucleotidase CysQ [Acidimicrobiales bacterium]